MMIDSHHHFWHYDPVEYDWIDENMKSIRRDFLPEHLQLEIQTAGIDGVVSVQARQTIEETDWLLRLANEHDFIKGVVGWLPIASDQLSKELDRLSEQPKLKALRHVVQGEPDGFLDQAAFNRGIEQLGGNGLVYDVLIFEHQLAESIRFVDRHPTQSFVLDHIAKPRIGDNQLEPWASNIRQLAQREHVTCKISGLVTEAEYDGWTVSQLQPYLQTVLEAFGPQRLMFGSDWPVCLVATGYCQWANLIRQWIDRLSNHEQNAILGDTATRIYQL